MALCNLSETCSYYCTQMDNASTPEEVKALDEQCSQENYNQNNCPLKLEELAEKGSKWLFGGSHMNGGKGLG